MYDASLYVAGERISRTAQPTFEVINPANEEVLGVAPTAGPDEIAAAVASAERALAVWSGASAFERSNVLRRIATLLRERADPIATLMTLEIGKPIAEARGEVMSAAEYFDWAAEETSVPDQCPYTIACGIWGCPDQPNRGGRRQLQPDLVSERRVRSYLRRCVPGCRCSYNRRPNIVMSVGSAM